MDKKTRKRLLELARKAITSVRDEKELSNLSKEKIVKMKSGVFVSVYVDDDLRGCIGSLEQIDLHDGVIRHALLAAYRDGRFLPIMPHEYARMKIHINILTEPKALKFKEPKELLKKMSDKNGYVIEKGYRKATFLPSVWEQLPKKEEFLSHLCLKAGMPPDEWKRPGMKAYYYGSEEFSE